MKAIFICEKSSIKFEDEINEKIREIEASFEDNGNRCKGVVIDVKFSVTDIYNYALILWEKKNVYYIEKEKQCLQ